MTENLGDWIYRYAVDLITDEQSGSIYTPASFRPEEATDDGRLVVVCWTGNPSTHSVLFHSGVRLGADFGITVDYRVDDRPANLGVRWWTGFDGRVIVPTSVGDVILGVMLSGQDKLTLRIHPSSGGSYTYQYSLVGLAEAVERLGCE